MGQPGTIGHGMPPRPNDTQRTMRDLQRQIDQMHGMIVQAANAANAASLKISHFQGDDASLDIASSWTEYEVGSPITPPAGFTRIDYMVTASAGTTFDSSGGLVGVQPMVWVFLPDGSKASASGPAISAGTSSGPCSVSGTFANGGSGNDPSMPLHFGAMAYATGTATAGSGNLHVSAQVIFSRE